MKIIKHFEHQHILFDQHTEGVYNFRAKGNSSKMARFKYFCGTCSTCFISESSLHNHNNCQKLLFRCNLCDYTSPSGDFVVHLKTLLHRQIEAQRKARRTTPSKASKEG